jgi:hypothetical protein
VRCDMHVELILYNLDYGSLNKSAPNLVIVIASDVCISFCFRVVSVAFLWSYVTNICFSGCTQGARPFDCIFYVRSGT